MVSYLYQMPSGIPGNVTRPEQTTIEAKMLDQDTPPTSFGVPVVLDNGVLRPVTTGDIQADVYGILVRPYPTSGNGTDGLGVATPNPAFPADVLKRGYINVAVGGVVAPVADGLVYIRVAAAAAGQPIGGFEAAADGGNTIIAPGNTYFTGGMDSNNNAEVAFTI